MLIILLLIVCCCCSKTCKVSRSGKGVPFLGFYYGVDVKDRSFWIDETRTSNFLHISPGFDQKAVFENLLAEISETGCYTMIDVAADITKDVETFNTTKWSWMLPIVRKYPETIKALYIADEPFGVHNEVCKKDLQKCIDGINAICDLIHKTTDFKIPIVTTLSSYSIRHWPLDLFHKYNLPSGLDWIGMDCYSNDFEKCGGPKYVWTIRRYYDWIIKHSHSHQYMTIVPPSWVNLQNKDNFRVDPSKIFKVYQDYYEMMKQIGIEKFKLILPFVWSVPQLPFAGAKNYPLLGLWWDMLFMGDQFKFSNDTYLNGLIFACSDPTDCDEKIFHNPTVSKSINLVFNDVIHPISEQVWTEFGCGGFLKVQSSDDMAKNSLGKKEIGDIVVSTSSSEIMDFLKTACILSFTSFTPPKL